MRAVIFLGGLVALSACGATVEEDISSRSDYSPLGEAYFLPVDGQTRAALATSPDWAELVESYD